MTIGGGGAAAALRTTLNTMATTSPLPKGVTSLLTLSRADLCPGRHGNDSTEEETLVLMQLPSTLSPSDLKSARIVVSESQQACLVVDSKSLSYTISRVETSNAYIMVPPYSSSSGDDERPRKKLKTGSDLVSVPACLLQPGGSGASFLELKPKVLSMKELHDQLKDHVFDPFSEQPWRGRSLDSLCVDLQCSEKQVLDGLTRMHAFSINVEAGTLRYGLLSEETLQEAKYLIVATLTECDEFQDYADYGISIKQCVDEVMKRSTEKYSRMKEVVQHTLCTLKSNESSNGDLIQLDMRKVAICVAHRLFARETEPWKEELLLAEWQHEMPGVGSDISIAMLEGVALLCSEKRQWKYFPQAKLPTDFQERFDMLFAEKEKWELPQIRPYLESVTSEHLTEVDLLQVYARIVTEDVDGVETKFVVKR